MLGMIGPAADTLTDTKKPSKKVNDAFSDVCSLKSESHPASTYSDSAKSGNTLKPVRANSSVRSSVSQKEISLSKPTPARPLTSTLIDLLDDNLSDFEVDDLDDTI